MPLSQPGGGATIPSTTNLLAGDGSGNAVASNFIPDVTGAAQGYFLTQSRDGTTFLGAENDNITSAAQATLQALSDFGTLSLNKLSSINTGFGIVTGGDGYIYGDSGQLIFITSGHPIQFSVNDGTASVLRIEQGLMIGTATDPGAGVLDVLTGYRIGNAAASGKILQGNGTNYIASTPTWPTTAGTAGYTLRSDGTNFTSYPQDIFNSSVSSQSPAAVDVYLAGSNVVVAAGDFKAKGQYRCVFDIVKSAGTGIIVLSLRIGTTGTVASDTARITFTFPAAGTSVADTGTMEVIVNWRTVGSGTSAIVSGQCRAQKNTITAAGLWGTTSAALTIVGTVSGGFASNTATNIGLSFNGSTAFAGTITTIQATLLQ